MRSIRVDTVVLMLEFDPTGRPESPAVVLLLTSEYMKHVKLRHYLRHFQVPQLLELLKCSLKQHLVVWEEKEIFMFASQSVVLM